jgi:hypothetical protein
MNKSKKALETSLNENADKKENQKEDVQSIIDKKKSFVEKLKVIKDELREKLNIHDIENLEIEVGCQK